MESDTSSISGVFGACIEEDTDNKNYNSTFCHASVRFFKSIKRVHRSLSGSLSSVFSWPRAASENVHNITVQDCHTKGRRSHSFAFGEGYNILSDTTDLGKVLHDVFSEFISVCNAHILESII